MRASSIALTIALLAGSIGTATADKPVQVVTTDQKQKCKFIKFIKEKSLNDALSRAAGYGADSFYVMTSTEKAGGGAEIDGQALSCKG